MPDISSSLRFLDNPPVYRGCVDHFDQAIVEGWVLSSARPMNAVPIEIELLGVRVSEIVSSTYRGDVAQELGLPVKAGFVFDFARISPPQARESIKRLREVEGASLPILELLSVRISNTENVLPFSDALADVRVSVDGLIEALMRAVKGARANEPLQVRHLLNSIPTDPSETDVSIVAYYLPQFHPFEENNEWWGEGFTEWTNVSTATPLFKDHNQPHLPADLGYYDLRVEQVQRDQIELARKYGITGFCYYYYWFSGKTLMTLPIDRHVEKDLPFDFCLCWANESWSRRWDGSESDVLIGQRHEYASDVDFIRSCLPYFRSSRYITIDGAPLLQVYRISLLERPLETIERWREIVRNEGFPDLHVSMVESFGLSEPDQYGCDSSCQFPPHGVLSRQINDSVEGVRPGYSGAIYDYAEVVRNEISRANPAHLRFRTAMPSWDNTSRKGLSGNVFAKSSPALFETWMRYLIADARARQEAGKRIVFINAWNEWAEGTHLEPDRTYGHANLRAVRNALLSASSALTSLLPASDPAMQPLRDFVDSILTSNRELTGIIRRDRYDLRLGEQLFFVPCRADLIAIQPSQDGVFNVDTANGRTVQRNSIIPASRLSGVSIRGWFAHKSRRPDPGMVSLRKSDDQKERYIAAIYRHEQRDDVVRALNLGEESLYCGFSFSASLQDVPPGLYELEFLSPGDGAPNNAVAIATSIHLLVG